MKSLHISIIITSVTSIGVGLLFFNLWQDDSRDTVQPEKKPLSDEQMIKLADTLEEVNAFKKKYPENQVFVDRASGYGVLYQAYPEKSELIDHRGEKIQPYVKLHISFSRNGLFRVESIYCIPNYERTQKIYEQDWLKHYKVLSNENIVNYLENRGCFDDTQSKYNTWTTQGTILADIDRITNTVHSVRLVNSTDYVNATQIEQNQKKIIQAALSEIQVQELTKEKNYFVFQVRHNHVYCDACICPEDGCALVGFSTVENQRFGVGMTVILNPVTGQVFDIRSSQAWNQTQNEN